MATSLSNEKKFIVEQLVHEYNRVSIGFHKAIDNYYKILPLVFSLLAFITGIIARAGISILYSIVPLFLMVFLHFENQIRNTIVCASKYLSHLETRINNEFHKPLYLYESQLTIGRVLYYSFNRLSFMKYLSYVPFLAIGIFIYIISLDRFYYYLKLKKYVELFDLKIHPMIVWYSYFIIIGAISISTIVSVLKLSIFTIKHYEDVLKNKYEDILQNMSN